MLGEIDLELKIQIIGIPESESDTLLNLQADLENYLKAMDLEAKIKPVEREKKESETDFRERGFFEVGSMLIIPLTPVVIGKLWDELNRWRKRHRVDVTVTVKNPSGEMDGEEVIVSVTQKDVSSKEQPAIVSKLEKLAKQKLEKTTKT